MLLEGLFGTAGAVQFDGFGEQRTMGKRKTSLKLQRGTAKAGMTSSLVVLTWTGFQRGRRYRRIHTWAGLAMIGFSVWHWWLYRPKRRPQKARPPVAVQRGADSLATQPEG